MALTKEIKTEQGFICPNAYLVVSEAIHYKYGNAQGRLDIYKDKEAKEAEMLPIRQWNFAFEYQLQSDLNIVQQAYIAVKGNPDYSDCLDA